ncbi:unnamed protein product [Fraxinus pennsylvanica]|uniref:Uncharacterized protein n=1 Tax=Fraxinus pennsylvanica TaxID=56036 RepID=A0AAD1Z2T8_9LAMI|nr:unnamed protein product [Fraxinus pennsylvanica]
MHLANLCIIFFLQMLVVPSAAELSARELDSLLQDYAFRALVRPRTGAVYDGNVPSNLTGVRVAAMRLRSGSLKRKGVSRYEEFHIPIGVVEQPYVQRLVLVYHNLANWSSLYYPLAGHTFLAPILGLLAYDGSNLSATGLTELNFRAAEESITIEFSGVQPGPEGSSSAKCVHFDLDGSVEFDRVISTNTCSTTKQGHYSIVVEAISPAPAPAPAGGGGGNSEGGGGSTVSGGGKGRRKVSIIVGSVVGGAILLACLGMLFYGVNRCRRRKKIQKMEEISEMGVALPMTRIGYTKAPVALDTRTRPSLENEFVP